MINTDIHSEADNLFALYDNDLQRVHQVLTQQFSVLQSRTQMLLTLSTIVLTITGFSGPRIGATHMSVRLAMAMGLVCVLISVISMLTGIIHLRFASQFLDSEHPRETVIAILAQRDRKTRIFFRALFTLVLGMAFYVLAIIAYLFLGDPTLAV